VSNTSSSRPRLLFICLQLTSFVREDLSILSETYDVRVFLFNSTRFSSKAGRIWSLLYFGVKQFFWLLRELPRAARVYGWFVDYHLVLPVLLTRLLKKPLAVAVGGFDAILLPDLQYGVYASSWRAPLARFVTRRATLLLPVSNTMIYTQNSYSSYPDELKNGMAHHVPGFQTPYKVIPTGYDPADWPMGPKERQWIVCSVANLVDDKTFLRKGIDLLFEAARRLPEITFRVVGVPPGQVQIVRERYNPPGNVELLPPRPRNELASIYGQASVYAQLSRAEGMPNVLAEAMCCGCIPVGSAVFGIPELIDDTGLLVKHADPALAAEIIRQALTLGPEYRKRARQRIITYYSRERRRKELLGALRDLR
jgi:glycosyltransferase involved in cell wall biosynthesis